jgi:hypothetical protein
MKTKESTIQITFNITHPESESIESISNKIQELVCEYFNNNALFLKNELPSLISKTT